MPDISTESDNVAIAAKIAAIIAEEMPEAHRQLKAAGQYYRYQDDPVVFCADVLGEFFTDDVKAIMESVRDYPVTSCSLCQRCGEDVWGRSGLLFGSINAFPVLSGLHSCCPASGKSKKSIMGTNRVNSCPSS